MEFGRLSSDEFLNGDLNLFCYTIFGWASGDFRKVLANAGDRYRAKVWLGKSFFERFPQYGFLASYDLNEYPGLHRAFAGSEHLRTMLLDAIRLYEARPASEVCWRDL